MSRPRLLVVMGSGETSPTMTKTHRSVFARVGDDAAAVLLDTPVGFQENADIVSAKAVEYFAESLQRTVAVASFRRADDDPLAVERAMARVREAGWVFTGPGSPTYAVRQWLASPLPELLRAKLRPGGPGGAVVVSSAAACSAGARTLPVYEIYKVGEDPHWVEGLDLVAECGLRAVVIPHYDNAEGGNHDTRYCYMGERRLRVLEGLLPEDVFVLGVDEHTAAVFDLDAATVTVTGNGGLSVRSRGTTRRFEAGTVVPITDLTAVASALRAGGGGGPAGPPPLVADEPDEPGDGSGADPLAVSVAEAEAAFDAAVAAGDAPLAVRAVLDLDTAMTEWQRDPTTSVERAAAVEGGRALLRTMVVRLGEVAEVGARDPRVLVGPYVEAMLDLRRRARAERRWADSDAIRDALVGAGVEIRDTPSGTDWLLGDR